VVVNDGVPAGRSSALVFPKVGPAAAAPKLIPPVKPPPVPLNALVVPKAGAAAAAGAGTPAAAGAVPAPNPNPKPPPTGAAAAAAGAGVPERSKPPPTAAKHKAAVHTDNQRKNK
jgi:hypothetical protein